MRAAKLALLVLTLAGCGEAEPRPVHREPTPRPEPTPERDAGGGEDTTPPPAVDCSSSDGYCDSKGRVVINIGELDPPTGRSADVIDGCRVAVLAECEARSLWTQCNGATMLGTTTELECFVGANGAGCRLLDSVPTECPTACVSDYDRGDGYAHCE